MNAIHWLLPVVGIVFGLSLLVISAKRGKLRKNTIRNLVIVIGVLFLVGLLLGITSR
jgi:cobalamin synthase